jgi:hypothetical protein
MAVTSDPDIDTIDDSGAIIDVAGMGLPPVVVPVLPPPPSTPPSAPLAGQPLIC